MSRSKLDQQQQVFKEKARTRSKTHADKRDATNDTNSNSNVVAREIPTGQVGPKRRPAFRQKRPPTPGSCSSADLADVCKSPGKEVEWKPSKMDG